MPDCLPSLTSHPPKSLTAAELSRAAAKAIRLSSDNNGLSDAIYVYNAVLLSRHVSAIRDGKKVYLPSLLPGFQTDLSHFSSVAIKFDQPVNPRLSGHALIHRLLRLGRVDTAHGIATHMLIDGHPVRTRTLESVVQANLPQKKGFLKRLFPEWRSRIKPIPLTKDALTLEASMIRDQGTRLTFSLIRAARQAGLKRSRAMMQTLMTLAIINGEISIAALIWGAFATDYDAQLQDTTALSASPAATPQDTIHKALNQATGPALPPCSESLATMCRYIQDILSTVTFRDPATSAPTDSHPPDTPTPPPDILPTEDDFKPPWNEREVPPMDDPYLPAFQALAHLASYLHGGLIHSSYISPLLKALSSAPRTDALVWVRDWKSGKVERRRAYDYFHNVLHNLCRNIPSRVQPGTGKRGYILDSASYNTLLNYALRQRYSPWLASDIIRHGISHGHRYFPDISTCNLLLRSATLLRQDDIASQALTMLGKNLVVFDEDANTKPIEAEGRSCSSPSPSLEIIRMAKAVTYLCSPPAASLLQSGHRSQTIRNSRHQFHISSDWPSRKLVPDQTTVTSLLHHFVAKGRPEIVIPLLHILIPELGIINDPGSILSPDQAMIEEMTPEERSRLKGFSRLKYIAHHSRNLLPYDGSIAIRRVVKYGPRFWVSMLNALSKSGKTATAERVFILARKAQNASWKYRFDVDGWCLPIEAYTIMLQMYASEAKRSTAKDYVLGRDGEDIYWQPRAAHKISAWAKFILVGRLHSKELGPYGVKDSATRVSAELGRILYDRMHVGTRFTYNMIMKSWDLRNYHSRERAIDPATGEVQRTSKRGRKRELRSKALAEGRGEIPVKDDVMDLDSLPFNHRSFPHRILPTPDARFFNAVLDLFGVLAFPSGKPPSLEEQRTLSASQYAQARESYGRSGMVSQQWQAMIFRVRRDMRRFGFDIPDGYKWMFVGKESEFSKATTKVRVDPKEYRVPRAFSVPGSSPSHPQVRSLYQLPVEKTRSPTHYPQVQGKKPGWRKRRNSPRIIEKPSLRRTLS